MFEKIKNWLNGTRENLRDENKDRMQSAIKEWLSMYKGEANWVNLSDGKYSGAVEKTLTRHIRDKVLTEATIEIQGESERALMLNDTLSRMKRNLNDKFEMALAVGGFIIKPYLCKGKIGIEFVLQGEYIPFGFDDDGNLIDVGFTSQIKKDNRVYTKIERHTLSDNLYTIETKAYDDKNNEVSLDKIPEWKEIDPVIILQSTINLYGYYRVPVANTVDIHSPMGVSVFENCKHLIKLADLQLSYLGWEYEGSQLACVIDDTALNPHNKGYLSGKYKLDGCEQRLYRGLDLGDDKLYEVFAPSLRDTSYREGLNEFYKRIEDIVGVARGTLSNVEQMNKTATEVVSALQREYVTITEHQAELERCLRQVYDALIVYANLSAMVGDSTLLIDWGDSVLVDREKELEEKLNLMNNGVLSSAEVRAFYTGETLEEAEQKIALIDSTFDLGVLDDGEGTTEVNE